MNETLQSPESSFFDFKPDSATIRKSAVNSILIQAMLKMKGVISMPILTYLMTPKEMGIFNLITVTSSVLIPLFTLNLPDGSMLFFAQEKSLEKIQGMYLTLINGVTVFTLLLTALGGASVLVFKRDSVGFAFWVALMIYANIFYKLCSAMPAIYQKTGLLLRNAVIRDLGGTVLAIVLVALGYSYKGMVFAGALFLVIPALLLLKKVFRFLSYSLTIDKGYLKDFFKISIPLLPVFFFSWIIQSSDSYFLNYYKGAEVVGKYSVIYGLCSVILVLTFALNFFWFPVSARLWIENREKYRKYFKLVFSVFSAALFLAVLLFELNAKLLMRIFARRADYQDAYVIMGIIAFAFAMQVLITLLTAPLYSNKNPRMIFFSYCLGGVINTFLNFILIPPYGIMGAAVSTAVAYLIIVVMMSALNYRVAKFRFLDRRFIYQIGLLLALWVPIVSIRGHVRVFQLIVVNVILVLAAGLAYYLKTLTKEEQRLVRSLFKGAA
jgi:O-antigen/teichoic acid export membrane protein